MDIDDIKVVIKLSGANRLPHLEEEIFQSYELVEYYIRSMVAHLAPASIEYNNNRSVAELLVNYAYCIVDGPWPIAEQIICKDNTWYKHYKNDVLGKFR